jgi:hypothetical protein
MTELSEKFHGQVLEALQSAGLLAVK